MSKKLKSKHSDDRIQLVWENWSHLPPTAKILLIKMACESRRTDGNLSYSGGREKLATALGYELIGASPKSRSSAFRSVQLAVRQLIEYQAIERIAAGHSGQNSMYRLNLSPQRISVTRLIREQQRIFASDFGGIGDSILIYEPDPVQLYKEIEAWAASADVAEAKRQYIDASMRYGGMHIQTAESKAEDVTKRLSEMAAKTETDQTKIAQRVSENLLYLARREAKKSKATVGKDFTTAQGNGAQSRVSIQLCPSCDGVVRQTGECRCSD